MLRQEDQQLDPALITATQIHQAETVLDPDGVYEELMGELVFRGQLPERSYWVSINDRGEVTLGPGERVARFQLLHEYYELGRTHLLGVDVEEILVPGLDSDKGYFVSIVTSFCGRIYGQKRRAKTNRIIDEIRETNEKGGVPDGLPKEEVDPD